MFQNCAGGQGGADQKACAWGFAPPGIWDLVRVHILTRSQSSTLPLASHENSGAPWQNTKLSLRFR